MDPEKKWADQPAWFLNVIVEGDQELLRIQSGGNGHLSNTTESKK